MHRLYFVRHVPHFAPVLVIGATLLAGCVVVRRPADVALDLGTAVQVGDVAHGERISSLSVYTVLASIRLARIGLEGCEPDVGGGVRCTLASEGCDTDYNAALTMHLEARSNGTYHVTAAALSGLFRTIENPDFGTLIFMEACGLPLIYSLPPYTELAPFLSSEMYSTALVPWPYVRPPTDPGDTALAMSRLAINRGALDAAIAGLQRALASGEDTATVVTTAVVEAAFTLGLHVTPPNRIDPAQRSVRPVWNHDADAYPTDTARLRRAIALLDFGMQVPHPGVDWHDVAVLGRRGHDITFTHTPSISAMEEMDGVAHYLLGRALMDAATRAQTCNLWTSARDALETGYTYLAKVPRVDQADDADVRMVKTIKPILPRADSARLRACRANT